MKSTLVVATRGSRLALWQAEHVKSRILALRPDLDVTLLHVRTKGDVILDVPLAQVGGKGLFIKEIEEALLDGRADLAVHSVKDMPAELPAGLVLACIPEREISADCFVSGTAAGLDDLPQGARVGTCSLRRQAQILARRPDLRMEMLRGNVETRLRRLRDGDFDAVILAGAGLKRLGLMDDGMRLLPETEIVPAVGQGALGLECREDDADLRALLAGMEHAPTRACVEAERGFLAGLDGGCQTPIAAHAVMDADDPAFLVLDGLVAELDGSRVLRLERRIPVAEARDGGLAMAAELRDMGAAEILARLGAAG